MDKNLLKASIEAKAKDLGFSFISFTQPNQTPHLSDYQEWITRGMNGSMKYLENASAIQSRGQPASLLAGARSVIVFGQHYQFFNSSNIDCQDYGIIASYALFPDYHHTLKLKAGELIAHMISCVGHQIKTKIFIDSSGLMEKDFAYMAGAGWMGKNSLLIVPPYGSSCMIGCIMTDLELAENPGEPYQDLCHDCRKCIETCPTHCIQENRTIDARRCIAYLTIEYKGIIPRSLRAPMGNHIFGCDLCQTVCPLNRQFYEHNNPFIFQNEAIIHGEIKLTDALSLTKVSFYQKFQMTPIIRASYDMFIRNILIAVGNSKSSQHSKILKNLIEKSDSPMIRSHAVWALGTIDPESNKPFYRNLIKEEVDKNVIKEISCFIN